jgi:hypothetical protein
MRKKRKEKQNELCRTGTEAQTVLFDAKKWTEASAKKWLLEHKMKAPKSDKTKTQLRFRQSASGKFKKGSFRTKTIDRKLGVKLVIGCPKPGTKSAKRKINPAPSIPDVLVYLGGAIEVQLADETMLRWRRGHCVLSNIEGNRLFILNTTKKKKVSPPQTARIDEARKIYSRFTDFESGKANLVKLALPKLTKIGLADHIVYRSNKWSGKTIDYIHEFTKRPEVWASSKKSPEIVVLVGDWIKVKKEGIAG